MNKILFTTLTIISSAVMAVGQDGSQGEPIINIGSDGTQGQPTINIGSDGTQGQPQLICYDITNNQNKNEVICVVKN